MILKLLLSISALRRSVTEAGRKRGNEYKYGHHNHQKPDKKDKEIDAMQNLIARLNKAGMYL